MGDDNEWNEFVISVTTENYKAVWCKKTICSGKKREEKPEDSDSEEDMIWICDLRAAAMEKVNHDVKAYLVDDNLKFKFVKC